MNTNIKIAAAFAFALSVVSCVEQPAIAEDGTRDPLLQPFSSESIWNMPIGKDAKYVDAKLLPPTYGMVVIDEDHIVLTPDAPLVDVTYSDGRFSVDADGRYSQTVMRRCFTTGKDKEFARLPIPDDFIVTPANRQGGSYNNGIAVLMPDKRYIYQGQPYAHCVEGGDHTLAWEYNVDPAHPKGYTDIYGDGLYGAHGGSRLSCIGGTLRVHELTPTSGPIQHALKMNIYGGLNMDFDHVARKGYRWPALVHDGYAENGAVGRAYNTVRPANNPVVKDCVMGSLLALKPEFDKSQLRTEPAKVIAQALIDYGAYIVDDTGWNVMQMVVEAGPAGNFVEEFEKNWGFPFEDRARGESTEGWSDWAKDMRDIFVSLYVIADNAPDNIGGAGERRVPKAAPLKKI